MIVPDLIKDILSKYAINMLILNDNENPIFLLETGFN